MANTEFTLCTRDEAKSLGLKRYFTGKPCHRGHIAERTVSSYGCLDCTRLKYQNLSIEQKRDRARRIKESRASRHDGEHYFTGKPCKRGHIVLRQVSDGSCIECYRIIKREYYVANKEKIKERAVLWNQENIAKVRDWHRKWRERNREYMRQHRVKTRPANAGRSKKWRVNNLDKDRQIKRQYSRSAKGRLAKAIRSSRTRRQMPSWANREAIAFFYECRPAGCHVDHVIPLLGKNISGLHVETNLQWLPARVNERKGNKWEG